MKAEFINNERRLVGQELSNDDNKIEKTGLSWVDHMKKLPPR
jgi:hypothetical protein